jgi:uncharacterized protein involved in outer membrane biogenesis
MSRGSAEKLQQQEEARKDSYTGMVQSTVAKIPDDYSSSQKADITTAEMGGIDAGFGNMKDEMMRRASATGSFAGMPESLSEATLNSTRMKADAGAQLQETFANVPVQRALQQASIFQPALGGMLYSRNVPTPGPSTTDSILGAAGSAALGAGIAV